MTLPTGHRSPSADDLAQDQLDRLFEFLRIPSVSAIPTHANDVRDAADWIVTFVRAAGGQAEVVDWNGRPIVDAWLRPRVNASAAPTILCYGHFDTQPAEPLELWHSDPFSPTVRDGWLYARGVADDKGQLWALLEAAADLSSAGLLPVNVRFCCDGEEEIGGSSIVEFLEENAGDPDACLIFDSAMLDSNTPVFTVAARGTIYLHVEVQTGLRDLHSGIYGGAALNALHVLLHALNQLFDDSGRPREELSRDVVPPIRAEAEEWDLLPNGNSVLKAQGAAPADSSAGDEFYERTWALPSIDINGVEGGSPVQTKTIVVSRARANLSMRLASGQKASRFAAVLRELLESNVPPSARLDVQIVSAGDPANTATSSPPIQIAASAVERVLGQRPLFLRSGGSLPLMPLLRAALDPNDRDRLRRARRQYSFS